MQPQTSGSPAQGIQPQTPVNPPRIVTPVPAHPRRHNYWWWALLLVAVAAGGVWWQTNRATETKQTGGAGVRSAIVEQGNLEKTIRLSGATGPENFVSIIAPQLRGGRTNYGRDGGSRSSQGGGTLTVQSNTTGTSSGGSGGSGDTMASTGIGSSNASSSRSVKGSTSRVGSGTSGGSGGGGSPSGGTSAASGADGMGSTAASLPGGGGGGGGGGGSGGPGGGGGSDFTLVLQKLANPGSPAKKGDVVGEFDRQYMLLRLDDYKASVASAESSAKKQRAELAVSNKAQEQTILAAKGAMDKAALDLKSTPVRGSIDAERLRLAYEDAKARYNQQLYAVPFQEIGDKAQIRASEIDLQQTKLELRRAEANADRMLSKAPINGLIVMMNTFRGGEFAAISAGDQLFPGQMYMQIVNPSSMVLNTTVNQADVELLRIGAKAKVHFDAYPDLELPARVVMIGAITKPGGLRMDFYKEVPVRLKLERMDPRVIPDLSISADVVVEADTQASIVPREAIFTERADAGKPFVFVQSAEGWQKRDVEVGKKNFTHISIRKGLAPGDRIALNHPDSGPAPNEKKE